MKRMTAVLGALLAVAAIAGCGTDDATVADDPPAVDSTSASPTGDPTGDPTGEPTAEPAVGTYPDFAPGDYTFHLAVSCFCLGAGVPIKVTVQDAAVVGAVYLHDDHGRSGVKKGDPADKSFWLTINDVIEAANNTTAESVEVVWPPGQDYPSSVFVDEQKDVADEEVGYAVSHVRVG